MICRARLELKEKLCEEKLGAPRLLLRLTFSTLDAGPRAPAATVFANSAGGRQQNLCRQRPGLLAGSIAGWQGTSLARQRTRAVQLRSATLPVLPVADQNCVGRSPNSPRY